MPAEKPRVVTVRMSHDLHTRLIDEAWRRRQSLNSLCLELLGVVFRGAKKAMDNSPGNPTPCSPVVKVQSDSIHIKGT